MYFTFIIFAFLFQEISLSKQIGQKQRILEEISEDIVILHTNDVHCGLNDTIGYDGFVLYLNELKKKYKNIITVDVGDHIQGGAIGAISSGEAIIKIANEIGFDVMILGNHEFDYSIEQLLILEKKLFNNSYICANFCYRKNKTSIFKPYKIIEKGRKKFAFISILTPLTFSKTYVSTIRNSEGEPIYDFLTGNNTQELYDTVQNYINKVKNDEKADYVILLTHIGMHVEQYTSDSLISKLEGVDLVLDGHTHAIYNTTTPDKNNKTIQISQTGTKLESIGKIIIKPNGTITSEIIYEIPEPSEKSNATTIFRAKKERWINTEMKNFIENIWKDYSDELNLEIGHSNFDLIIKPENATDSRSIYCRYKECTLGNILSDAVRNAGNAEITILNGGSIRNNMPKGNITRKDIIEIMPWFNNIVVKKIKGQNILDALEFGVSKLPDSSGGFPQVSGITFDVDTSFKSPVITDENGMFINIAGKRRVSNVKINGEDLDLNKNYNTSLIEFIANGGDGYSMFSQFEIFNESLVTDTDALGLFILDNLQGEIPEKYKDFQGRINIYNKSQNNESDMDISSLNKALLIGFDNYTFLNNIIHFYTYIRLVDYSNDDIKNISLKANIDYKKKNRLRNLDETLINCQNKGKQNSDIFTILCSKEVNGEIEKISYINDSIEINGEKIDLDKLDISDYTGKNIEKQKNTLFSLPTYILEDSSLITENKKIIIRGNNKNANFASSSKTYLIFNENSDLKNISCSLIEEINNIYELTCEPISPITADLRLNNIVNIKDQNKNFIINFKEDSNSKANLTYPINENNNYRTNSRGLTTGGIIAIILTSLLALIAIVSIAFALNRGKINIPPPISNNMFSASSSQLNNVK